MFPYHLGTSLRVAHDSRSRSRGWPSSVDATASHPSSTRCYLPFRIILTDRRAEPLPEVTERSDPGVVWRSTQTERSVQRRSPRPLIKDEGTMRITGLMHRTRCPENDCDRWTGKGVMMPHAGRDEEGRVREGCICAYGSREDALPIGCLHRYQNSIGIRIENGLPKRLPSYRQLMPSCEWTIVSTPSSSVDRSIRYWTESILPINSCRY